MCWVVVNFMWIIFVQKLEEIVVLICLCMVFDQRQLVCDFEKFIEVDDDIFVVWVDKYCLFLDVLFFGILVKVWEDFVIMEN